MKKLLLLSTFLLAGFFANAQAVQDWTAGLPPMTSNYYNHTLAADSQGNVYAVGNYDGVSRDFDPGPGVFNISSAGQNMYIVNLNAAGNFVLAKQITGGFSAANAITIDASDNLYITGYSANLFGTGIDFDPGVGVVNVNNSGVGVVGYVMYILKLDANGNHILNKQFKNGTSSYPNYINALTVDAAGNIYGTGSFFSTLDFDPDAGTTNLTANGNSYSPNIFILKLNPSGSLAWAKGLINTVGGNNPLDEGYGIGVDTSGNVYTTGYYTKGIDADPGTGVFNLVAFTGDNPTIVGANVQYVSKLDTNGNFVWAYDLKGDHSINVLPSLVVDSANNIIVSGYNQDSSPDYDFSAATYTLPNDTSAFIFKINTNAGLIWAKSATRETTSFNHNSFCIGLTLDAAGNIYTTGSFGYYGPADFDPSAANYILTTSGNNDGCVSKLDANGNFVWANKIGGSGDEYCFSIAVSPFGKVTVSGKTSTGFAKSVTAVTTGGFLASYSQPALATTQFELDKNISVYPNPTAGEFNILVNNDLIGAKVIVYNIIGQKIKDFSLDVLYTTQNLDKGMYLLEIEKDNNKTTRKLIVN